MIKQLELLKKDIDNFNFNIIVPKFTAIMSENELLKIIADYDGWIIGDDQVTEKILIKGKSGKLKYLVKWGVGIDNVDFDLCKKHNIPVSNTPAMFGEEVSDIAVNYLLTLARQTHRINEEVRKGNWFKPTGNSLSGKKLALVGFGDIGRHIAKKLLSFNLNIYVYDPSCSKINGIIKYNYGHGFNNHSQNLVELLDKIKEVNICTLEECINNSDFIIIACQLNKQTQSMINKDILLLANIGVILINIARGPIIVEKDVIELLKSKHIESVGFDVFENEPLNLNNELLNFKQNIYGSHNSSNTIEAVLRTSILVLTKLYKQLK